MATKVPISGLTALGGAPAANDLLVTVDVSDPTQGSSGTTKSLTVANLFTSPAIATPTLTNPTVSGAATLTGGTVTVSTPLLSGTQTWNAGGVAFTGWKLNVTNTASAAASLLLDLQVASASVWNVGKAGDMAVTGVSTFTGISVHNNGARLANAKYLTGIDNAASERRLIGVDASNIVQLSVDANAVNIGGTTTVAADLKVGVAAAKNLVVAGGGGQIATNATVGFLMTSSCAGTPTGTPASIPTGTIPFVYDATNNRIYFYSGSWRSVAVA